MPYFLSVSLDLQDLLLGLLCIAGIAALVGLTLLFIRLAGVLLSLKTLLDENRKSLKVTVDHVSDVTGNLVDITDELAEFVPGTLEQASDLVESVTLVAADATEVTGALTGVIKNLLGYLQRGTSSLDNFSKIARTVLGVSRAFAKKGKKKGEKKFAFVVKPSARKKSRG